MSNLKVAQSGQEKDAPKKVASKKTAAELRIEELTKKIEGAHELKSKISARALFDLKREQIADAKSELLEESESDDWTGDTGFKVTFESGKYNNKVVLSFCQAPLILDFIEFMQDKIEDKILKLDNAILSQKL